MINSLGDAMNRTVIILFTLLLAVLMVGTGCTNREKESAAAISAETTAEDTLESDEDTSEAVTAEEAEDNDAGEGMGETVTNENNEAQSVPNEVTVADAPDINTADFHESDTPKSDELSYLQTPGFLHEFSYNGGVPGSGEEWEYTNLTGYKKADDGRIEETMISTTSDGETKYTDEGPQYVYYEETTGLYRQKTGENSSPTPVTVIKYPIKLGDKWTDFEIVAVNETITTEAGVFENVVGVRDWNNNTKYYAPGVGLIKYEGIRDSGELVKISK